MRIYLIIVGILISSATCLSQELPIYRQYYFTPALINPALNGVDPQNSLNLYYRKQWLGVEDSPELAGLNFQLPTKGRLFFGLDVFSEQAVLLRKTATVVTVGYGIPLSQHSNLRFAMAVGAGLNTLDVTTEEINSDPVIAAALQNNIYLDARFGVAYTNKNFTLGFSLPQLFESNQFSTEPFAKPEFSEFSYRIAYASYKFYISPSVQLSPQVLFMQNSTVNDIGGALGLHYKDLFWVGGTYQNTVGGFVGLSIKNIQIQYNYESSNFEGTIFDNSSHGIQLGIKLGKRKERVIKGTSTTATNTPLATQIEERPQTEPEKLVEPPSQPTQTATETTQPAKEPVKESIVKQEPETKPVIPAEKQKPEVETESDKPDLLEPVEKQPDVVEEVDLDNPMIEESVLNRSGGLKMTPGYYVVVGVFSMMDNAMKVSRKIQESGHLSDMLINPKNNYYYVFVYYNKTNREQALEVRKAFRKKREFKDAWIMDIKE